MMRDGRVGSHMKMKYREMHKLCNSMHCGVDNHDTMTQKQKQSKLNCALHQ